MKQLFLFLLFLNFLTLTAQHVKSTTFGFKGGMNNSIVNGKEPDGSDTGYVGIELYASLFSDTELSAQWNLENELLFSWTDDYHFVEIPVHLKYRATTKWSFLAGPKLDIIADNDNDGFEAGYQFQNFGVSGEIGVQYNFTKKIFAETRYSKSFTAQIDDLALDIFGGKRNTFRIGLGIRF